jgi:hypothetical protein
MHGVDLHLLTELHWASMGAWSLYDLVHGNVASKVRLGLDRQ